MRGQKFSLYSLSFSLYLSLRHTHSLSSCIYQEVNISLEEVMQKASDRVHRHLIFLGFFSIEEKNRDVFLRFRIFSARKKKIKNSSAHTRRPLGVEKKSFSQVKTLISTYALSCFKRGWERF